jgi:ribonuclease Z
MSIRFDILGAAGRDNALIVTLDSGQIVDRLLFDCGAGLCLRNIRSGLQPNDLAHPADTRP